MAATSGHWDTELSLEELVQQATDEANAANEKRYQEALQIANQIAAKYSDASFGQGYRNQLETAKKQSVSQGMNSLIQAGLGATGGAAGLATSWEQSVGAGARLNLEDMLAQRQVEALQTKLGVVSSKEDQFPDYSQLYAASAAGASTPSFTTGGGGFNSSLPLGGYEYGSLGGGGTTQITTLPTSSTDTAGTSQSDAWWKWWKEMQDLEAKQTQATVNTGTGKKTKEEEELAALQDFYGY